MNSIAITIRQKPNPTRKPCLSASPPITTDVVSRRYRIRVPPRGRFDVDAGRQRRRTLILQRPGETQPGIAEPGNTAESDSARAPPFGLAKTRVGSGGPTMSDVRLQARARYT